MRLSHYRKSIAAFVGAGLTWAGTAYVPDGHVDRPELYALAVALATVAGVYAVANATPTDPPPRSSEPDAAAPVPGVLPSRIGAPGVPGGTQGASRMPPDADWAARGRPSTSPPPTPAP